MMDDVTCAQLQYIADQARAAVSARFAIVLAQRPEKENEQGNRTSCVMATERAPQHEHPKLMFDMVFAMLSIAERFLMRIGDGRFHVRLEVDGKVHGIELARGSMEVER